MSQFYLLFVGLLVAGHAVGRRAGPGIARALAVSVFGALFTISVLVHQGVIPNVHRGVALDRWHEFFIGALAWWVVAGWVRAPILLLAWIATAVVHRHPDAVAETAIVVLVSLWCILSATRPAFNRPFASGSLQFLGAFSYSLYLYHASIGWRVVSLVQRKVGMAIPGWLGVATWLAAIVAAIVVAAIGTRLLKRPSVRLSRRIALPRRVAVPVPEAVSAAAGAAVP
jgi:peptidoglycan/LPS O-acetylase OafA/YrhL